MKLTLILMLTFTTLTASGSTLELTFKEHFTAPKILMNDVIRMDLLKIKPDLTIEERMLAADTKKKSGWGENLRDRLQGLGNFTRL